MAHMSFPRPQQYTAARDNTSAWTSAVTEGKSDGIGNPLTKHADLPTSKAVTRARSCASHHAYAPGLPSRYGVLHFSDTVLFPKHIDKFLRNSYKQGSHCAPPFH
jgi:hypothetical protein